jgi:hypothetical protein
MSIVPSKSTSAANAIAARWCGDGCNVEG